LQDRGWPPQLVLYMLAGALIVSAVVIVIAVAMLLRRRWSRVAGMVGSALAFGFIAMSLYVGQLVKNENALAQLLPAEHDELVISRLVEQMSSGPSFDFRSFIVGLPIRPALLGLVPIAFFALLCLKKSKEWFAQD